MVWQVSFPAQSLVYLTGFNTRLRGKPRRLESSAVLSPAQSHEHMPLQDILG